MKILVVGNGGREHALLWKLRRDAPAARLYVTRGNGGTDALAESLPLDPGDAQALAGWAEAERVGLTVVGPEGPLADGLVDVFLRRGLPAFGPTREAAAIESSKSFAKGLMRDAGVPTADFRTFTDADAAVAYIQELVGPVVVKASGLAAGKGAVVCDGAEEAMVAARAMLEGRLGDAGREIVVEERMAGEELSVFALTDGERALLLLPSQDHKRLGEGDVGPNTGGMGAYAPVSLATPQLLERIREEIFQPTLGALRERGRPFRGLLYAGLMLTDAGPRVVEFNARFGDPETQVVLPLLASSLLEPLLAVARGDALGAAELSWRPGAALTTVLASRGYPEGSEKGVPIELPRELTEVDDLVIFHAGTALDDGRLVTAGGRVLAVTGLGPDLPTAARRSREGAEAIRFPGRQLRRDIGWRELRRQGAPS